MASKNDIISGVDGYFSGKYEITDGRAIPNVGDIPLGKYGREMELAILFIDIRESTKIVDTFRRVTAAKMYKSFLWGVTQIARNNGGELRSFNGDGVLVVFSGEEKRTNAAKTALQLSWFVLKVMKPKVEAYFRNNNENDDLKFDCGIGIDVGKVLIVRGGIKGENNNDLVWVGNATNYAVKLADLAGEDDVRVHISKNVYTGMLDSGRLSIKEKTDMWEKVTWTRDDGTTKELYRSSWTWTPS